MSRTALGLLLVLAGVVGGAVTGCATQTTGTATPATPAMTAPPTPSTTTPPQPPPEPKPAREAPCPYLEDEFVEQTNGQRVGETRISADEPHAACFFYRSDGKEQLRVQVAVGLDPATARAMVDLAAPVDTSDPASLPGGWEGGKQPTDRGAVFAVHKDGAAVVVIGNQEQTIKVSRIAEQVVTALGI